MNKIILGARFNLRIEDFSANHVLVVECPQCGHSGQVSHASLNAYCKPHERVITVVERMRCSACRNAIGLQWWAGERL